MTISFYESSITPITRTLTSLKGILAEGHKFALSEGIDEQEMLSMKLFDNMFDLKTQIGTIYFLAIHQGAMLVAGLAASNINQSPASFADLDENISVMLSDLAKIDPESYNAKISDPVALALPMGKALFESAEQQMSQWVIPHLYFHVTTAYDILRHNGVPLTKSHFLGKIDMRLEAAE